MRCRALLLGAGWALACGLMYPVHGVAEALRSAENARLLNVAPPPAVPTDLFASDGDAPGTPVATDDELSVVTWQVVPRIVELARAPKQLRVVLGTREALVVNQIRFEPREGFYLAEEPDDYIVDDDPTRVS